MSMLGGLMGGGSDSNFDYKPAPAPGAPFRGDPANIARSWRDYKNAVRHGSYVKSILGGSAPGPAKSYTAQLFNASGAGM